MSGAAHPDGYTATQLIRSCHSHIYTVHRVLVQVKTHASPVLYPTKTFTVETPYAAIICYVKANQRNSAVWSHSNEPLWYYYYYVSPTCGIKAEGNGWGIQWIVNVVLFSIFHNSGYDRDGGCTTNTQCYQVVQVSSDTAQISCNTVTQYCSVFCLTAVIVGYCGCGWFRYNSYTKTGRGHYLARRVNRFWCGMPLAPSNMNLDIGSGQYRESHN